MEWSGLDRLKDAGGCAVGAGLCRNGRGARSQGDNGAGRAESPQACPTAPGGGEQNRPSHGSCSQPKPRLPAKSVVTGPDLRCSQEVKAMDHGLVSEMHCQAQAWLQWSSSKDQGQEHHLKSLTRAKGS